MGLTRAGTSMGSMLDEKGGVNGDKVVGRELVGIRLSEDSVSA